MTKGFGVHAASLNETGCLKSSDTTGSPVDLCIHLYCSLSTEDVNEICHPAMQLGSAPQAQG